MIGAVTWEYLTSKGRHDYCKFCVILSQLTLFLLKVFGNIKKVFHINKLTVFKVLKNDVHSRENSSDISIKLFTIYMFIYFYNWSTIF